MTLKPALPAAIRYELRLVNNTSVRLGSATVTLKGSNDAACIVRVVTANGLRVNEEIVGMLTSEGMLQFRAFVAAGGGVTLGRELDF